MVVTYRCVLAGAALLAAGVTGASADYYRGAEALPAAAMQPAGWYVRGDYSYAWQDIGDLNRATAPFETFSLDNTWAIGGGIGYYFGRGVRGDITYEYRGRADVHGGTTATTDFDIASSLLLASLYYDFRPYERFTPYVGIGLGVAHHRTSAGSIVSPCGTPCSYDGDSNRTAAGALMAGFSFRVDRGHHAPVSIKDTPVAPAQGRLHIDVGYRFLYLGDAHAGNVNSLPSGSPVTPGPRVDDITAHEIRVGLRWDIR
jgi:opacity protein-like surface antigen